MFTQGGIQDGERLASSSAMEFCLLEHAPDAAAIDRVLAPGGFREKAGKVGWLMCSHHAACGTIRL
jgi:hypothetical protein